MIIMQKRGRSSLLLLAVLPQLAAGFIAPHDQRSPHRLQLCASPQLSAPPEKAQETGLRDHVGSTSSQGRAKFNLDTVSFLAAHAFESYNTPDDSASWGYGRDGTRILSNSALFLASISSSVVTVGVSSVRGLPSDAEKGAEKLLTGSEIDVYLRVQVVTDGLSSDGPSERNLDPFKSEAGISAVQQAVKGGDGHSGCEFNEHFVLYGGILSLSRLEVQLMDKNKLQEDQLVANGTLLLSNISTDFPEDSWEGWVDLSLSPDFRVEGCKPQVYLEIKVANMSSDEAEVCGNEHAPRGGTPGLDWQKIIKRQPRARAMCKGFVPMTFLDNEETGTQCAFWADMQSKRMILSFRGTEDLADIVTDVNVFQEELELLLEGDEGLRQWEERRLKSQYEGVLTALASVKAAMPGNVDYSSVFEAFPKLAVQVAEIGRNVNSLQKTLQALPSGSVPSMSDDASPEKDIATDDWASIFWQSIDALSTKGREALAPPAVDEKVHAQRLPEATTSGPYRRRIPAALTRVVSPVLSRVTRRRSSSDLEKTGSCEPEPDLGVEIAKQLTDIQQRLQGFQWVPNLNECDESDQEKASAGLPPDDEEAEAVLQGALEDINSASSVNEKPAVHAGFLRAYLSVRQSVADVTKQIIGGDGSDWKIYMTGHSLGGALATLSTVDISRRFASASVTAYSFGSPRVGNKAFVDLYNSLNGDSFRIVNDQDIVARMPRTVQQVLDYDHVGRTVVMDLDGRSGRIWVEGVSKGECPIRESNKSQVDLDRGTSFFDKEVKLLNSLLSGESLAHHLEPAYYVAVANARKLPVPEEFKPRKNPSGNKWTWPA
jgi:hypothetical protein